MKNEQAESLKSAEQILSRAYSASAMTKRQILLSSRVKLISRAFEEAENVIYSLPEEKYTDVLSHLLADAAEERLLEIDRLTALYGDTESAEAADFEAVFNESDREKYGKAAIRGAKKYLAEKSPDWKKIAIRLSDSTAPVRGGVILRYGDLESNCSIAAMIESSKREAQAQVARILFENETVTV